jgi:isopentenyl diphosphate isomerase/L-lactate dehydrogenase-like FMN-dependent dehydrogenase
LNWNDISWLRKHTKLPIGLKGIQSVEDAKKATELGVDAIYLSNHGSVFPPSCLFYPFGFVSRSFQRVSVVSLKPRRWGAIRDG